MIWLISAFKNKNNCEIWAFYIDEKKVKHKHLFGKGSRSLTCLLQILLKCVVTAIKWTVKRESCKTEQWVMFQRGCWCTKYTSQCPSPYSLPAIYNLVARSITSFVQHLGALIPTGPTFGPLGPSLPFLTAPLLPSWKIISWQIYWCEH